MIYIVYDLEWNQPERLDRMIQDPFVLHGEIIQIGAVKLDKDLTRLDTFKIIVHPVYYRKMNKKVSHITGLSDFDLNYGFPFSQSIQLFREWCGEDFCFLTWGSNDEEILRSNLAMHGQDSSWLPRTYDIQYMFERQFTHSNRSPSLSNALRFLRETSLEAHDALHDALNAAQICHHLDLETGLADYDLPMELGNEESQYHLVVGSYPSTGFQSRREALAKLILHPFVCPKCREAVIWQDWLKQHADRYISIAECTCGAQYYARIRVKGSKDRKFKAARNIQPLSSELLEEYLIHKNKNIENSINMS